MAAPMKIMRACLFGAFRPYTNSLHVSRVSHMCRTTSSLRTLTYNLNSGPVSIHRICGANILSSRSLSTTRLLSAEAEAEAEAEEEYHSIIKDTERAKGPTKEHEFQAETRKLLDIVAKSLYSEKEVFIRELISNASDSLEKFRYVQLTSPTLKDKDAPLEIHIAVNEEKKTFTIQDTGVGMTKDEMIENLGTIAKSGSKSFLDEHGESNGDVNKNIIGQFGVGFYSTFMVGDKVEVYSQSYKEDEPAYKWVSDGLGSYELTEAEGVQRGTKIVAHLRGDSYDFAKEQMIKDVIKKYSNFVGVPIFVNGQKVNTIQAVWTMETRDITDDIHNEFYRFISNNYDYPQYHLHYKADAPINIRALFYVPDSKPNAYERSAETDVSVSLYSRKVMILAKANHILPHWLRFLRGVVDSEDIPLNLSRELLQDSSLIKKLRWVLTNRLIKFFLEQAKKDMSKYLEFYDNYGIYFREGIMSTPEQEQREEIARLLRFESSKQMPDEKTSLDEYVSRMEAGSRVIYYICAPSRQLAENSPYMEAMKKQDKEVLLCYDPYDEIVLLNMGQFDRKTLKSVENEVSELKDDEETTSSSKSDSLDEDQSKDLLAWLQLVLGNRVKNTKVTHRLDLHPCVVTVAEMGAVRHFLKSSQRAEEDVYNMLQTTLEINPSHTIIREMYSLKQTDPDLARLVAEQIYDNAMIAAGLVTDARGMLGRLNDILSRTLSKR